MRTALFTLAISAFCFAAHAQNNAQPAGGAGGPMISLDKEEIDFGTIKQGADGNRQFTVKNTGNAPLIISQCQGSCGCTVPKCDNAPIAPGKTSVVNVHYDTNRVGPFTKTVTVTSNAVNTPSKMVTIHGTVEATATTTPTAPVMQKPIGTPRPETAPGKGSEPND